MFFDVLNEIVLVLLFFMFFIFIKFYDSFIKGGIVYFYIVVD